jgi:hypothetical protein
MSTTTAVSRHGITLLSENRLRRQAILGTAETIYADLAVGTNGS